MLNFRILGDDFKKEPTRWVVVDDNENLLKVWHRILSKEESCVAYLTTNPWEALEEIKIHQTDILITDLVMPTLSGFQLAQKVLEIFPEMQIFITTGNVELLEKESVSKSILDVLQKPFVNLHNIQSFVHDLATHQPLDRSHCIEKGPIHLWNL